MSVTIPNMEMPENCGVCMFSDWSNLHQTAACKLCEYEPCFEDFNKEYEKRRSDICPLQPERKAEKWKDYREDGFLECPVCGAATTCNDNADDLHYCFSCGTRLEVEQVE